MYSTNEGKVSEVRTVPGTELRVVDPQFWYRLLLQLSHVLCDKTIILLVMRNKHYGPEIMCKLFGAGRAGWLSAIKLKFDTYNSIYNGTYRSRVVTLSTFVLNFLEKKPFFLVFRCCISSLWEFNVKWNCRIIYI